MTGAETCELVLALDVVGDPTRALQVFADMQHLRHAGGLYWTGYVFDEDVFWPDEQTTYTSAAVILAADALSRTTPGVRHLPRRRSRRRTRSRWRCTAAAAADRGRASEVVSGRRRSARIEPARADLLEAVLERAQVDLVRRPPAVGRVGEDVVDEQQTVRRAPTAPSDS